MNTSTRRASRLIARHNNNNNNNNGNDKKKPPKTTTATYVKPDIIDNLDTVGGTAYHHAGPYDAMRPEMNRIPGHSPLVALKKSDEEALKAVPRRKAIIDAVECSYPLDLWASSLYSCAVDIYGNVYEIDDSPEKVDMVLNSRRRAQAHKARIIASKSLVYIILVILLIILIS